MDAAALLGLPTVNAFVGANHLLSLEDNFKLFEKVWPDLVRYAEDRDVRIGIENCPMLFENTWPFGLNLARTPAIWRRMFEIIPSPNFGLNYDPSHLRMQLIQTGSQDYANLLEPVCIRHVLLASSSRWEAY